MSINLSAFAHMLSSSPLAIYDPFLENLQLAAMSKNTEDFQNAISAIHTSSNRQSIAPAIEGVSIIPIQGLLAKRTSDVTMFDGQIRFGTAQEEIQAAALEVGNDESIHTVVLDIETGGGVTDAVFETGEIIRDLRSKKTVIAVISEMGASAGYWLAAQATKVFINPLGISGSIGTMSFHIDLSEMHKNEGSNVEIFRSGPLKGAGALNTALTKEQREMKQATVDSVAEQFISEVAKGRNLGIKKVRKLATGAVFIGQAAVDNGLVDGIASLDQVLSSLNSNGESGAVLGLSTGISGSLIGEITMAAATIAELKATFPDDSDFILSQAEKGATLDQAKGAWASVLEGKLKASESQNATLKAEAEARVNAEADAKLKAEADEKIKAEAEAKIKAEADAKLKKKGGDVRPPISNAPDANDEDDTGVSAIEGISEVELKDASKTLQKKVQALMRKGMNAIDAGMEVDRQYPNLRHLAVEQRNPGIKMDYEFNGVPSEYTHAKP